MSEPTTTKPSFYERWSRVIGMSRKTPIAIVVCPHCGDRTEQDFLLVEFTCGNCDRPFKTHAEPLEIVTP